MSLIARIEEELAEARRDRDAERRDALSLILAQLRSAEKELQLPPRDTRNIEKAAEKDQDEIERGRELRESHGKHAARPGSEPKEDVHAP